MLRQVLKSEFVLDKMKDMNVPFHPSMYIGVVFYILEELSWVEVG